MQLKAWVRGSYKCLYTSCIALGIMGLAALIPGFVLLAENDIPSSNPERDETIIFATGVGLIILGVFFFISSAILLGCTICLISVYEEDSEAPELELTSFVRRSQLCTMVTCILLALSGVTIVFIGWSIMVKTYLPFVSYVSQSSDIVQRAVNYAGGLLLTRLAAILLIWAAALAICAFYLRRAIMGKMDAEKSTPPTSHDLKSTDGGVRD